jgi:hypothetical protein
MVNKLSEKQCFINYKLSIYNQFFYKESTCVERTASMRVVIDVVRSTASQSYVVNALFAVLITCERAASLAATRDVEGSPLS